MPIALDAPALSGVLTHWTVQPVAIIVVLALAITYWRGVRGLGRPWPRGRTALFTVGLALLLFTSTGFPQVYNDSLYWVWTSQTLVLWLLVPILVLSGHPLQLARARGGRGGRLDLVLRSKPVRVISNPLVGPALVPLLSFVLFFGPLPGWAIAAPPVGWLLQLLLLLVGGAMVLPLVGLDDDASSLAVGLGLAIGSFELVIDALPGIVLRLHTKLATSWFDHVAVHSWTPRPIRDQQLAGGILWTIAELIDLPFLFLVYRRWLRADARDAARVDAVLEAERWARRGPGLPGDDYLRGRDGIDVDPDAPEPDTRTDRDAPWWITDPAMQRRLRRQR